MPMIQDLDIEYIETTMIKHLEEYYPGGPQEDGNPFIAGLRGAAGVLKAMPTPPTRCIDLIMQVAQSMEDDEKST